MPGINQLIGRIRSIDEIRIFVLLYHGINLFLRRLSSKPFDLRTDARKLCNFIANAVIF